ncbi:hypothetical protein BLNAU_10557 [Blattamonas nauphoetae]|uniref:Uncharacterized protein n=1 Tax=Blattamonas nauphoetae TaxID=2049346 RepID=A0ABQ9XSW9_9EUKA|nr:hypothetical protein BLNAU_10557 [Blattamonas nauphoetae]
MGLLRCLLIPHPKQEATISRISCNRVDESTATLQMLTESAVEGRMLALLDIFDGSTTPNDDSSHPFPRLVIFVFPELGTQSVPTTVCLDEWDELKIGAEFKVVVAAKPNTTICPEHIDSELFFVRVSFPLFDPKNESAEFGGDGGRSFTEVKNRWLVSNGTDEPERHCSNDEEQFGRVHETSDSEFSVFTPWI